jgi:parallel beta-helix repeat protein
MNPIERLCLTICLAFLLLIVFPQLASTQRGRTQRASSSTPTPTSSSNQVPSPSGLIVRTSSYQAGDLGSRINAADKALGTKAGWIIVDTSGEISTQVHISAGHTLKFGNGRFSLLNPEGNRWRGVIMLEDNTSVYGEGEEKTVLVEPPNAYICIQSTGVATTERGYSGVGIISNIKIAGFTLEGSNTRAEGGVNSTIELGNAHHVHIYNVKLKSTSCLGISAGGTGLTGKHAEDWIVENCAFEGVASQNLNVVNGSHITFRFNAFLGAGKICGNNPCEGVTPIDVEPNTASDAASFISINDNLIDSTNSPFQHGNGILIQNNVGVMDFGPVSVAHNRIIGGPLRENYAGNIHIGIYLAGASNTTVNDNEITRTSASGLRAENAKGNTIEKNKIVSTGTGGIEAVNFINSFDNRFAFNSVTVDPRSPLGNTVIAEIGASDRNTYVDNVPQGIILVGKASKIIKSLN